MLIIDPPPRSASSTSWRSFLEEMRDRRDNATSMSDIIEIDRYIQIAEDVLAKRR